MVFVYEFPQELDAEDILNMTLIGLGLFETYNIIGGDDLTAMILGLSLGDKNKSIHKAIDHYFTFNPKTK